MILGRVVAPDEPAWLPEDRDVLEVWSEFQRSRHVCGHWRWEWEDMEGLTVDFEVCPFCVEVNKFADGLRDKHVDMYAVSYGFYPPREDNG